MELTVTTVTNVLSDLSAGASDQPLSQRLYDHSCSSVWEKDYTQTTAKITCEVLEQMLEVVFFCLFFFPLPSFNNEEPMAYLQRSSQLVNTIK